LFYFTDIPVTRRRRVLCWGLHRTQCVSSLPTS